MSRKKTSFLIDGRNLEEDDFEIQHSASHIQDKFMEKV